MKQYSLKEDMKNGKPLMGIWAQTASPETVEMIGCSGYDFAIVDMEHGCMGVETAESLVRAADAMNLPVLVRVLDNQPSMIMKALDSGAAGVLVPGISCKADALKAVSAAKYAPMGIRGACPFVRSVDHFAANMDSLLEHNGTNIVVLLVEGKQAVEEFDDIVSIPGVDGIITGPVDLSFSLGVGGQINHPKVREAIEGMIKKSRAANVPMIANIFSTDPAEIARQARNLAAIGVPTVICNSDKTALLTGLRIFSDGVRQGRG